MKAKEDKYRLEFLPIEAEEEEYRSGFLPMRQRKRNID